MPFSLRLPTRSQPAPPRRMIPWRPRWECRPDHEHGHYLLDVCVLLPDGRVYAGRTTILFGLWERLKPRDRVGWLEYRVTGMLSRLPTRH